MPRWPNWTSRRSRSSTHDVRAYANLEDAKGGITLIFLVGKAPEGATLASYAAPDPLLSPCTIGVSDRTERTLSEGTVARATTANPPSKEAPLTYVTALRPDGTYIQVQAGLETRASAPFTLDDMFKFAELFVY